MLQHHHAWSAQRLPIIALAGVLALVLAGSASATLFVRVSDADLADGSDAVVLGVVRSVDDAAGVEAPRTAYEIEIREQISGELEIGSSLTIDVPGGVLGEWQLRVDGVPRMAEDERLLLFLKRRGDGGWTTRHLVQGVFRIVPFEGRNIAFRDFAGLTELPLPGRKVLHAEQPRDLGRFVAWLRDRASSPRPADYFVGDVSSTVLRDRWSKFTLIRNNGIPIRFREFDSGGSISFFSHNSNQPGLASGGHAEFQTAIRAWNNEPSTPINIVYRGRTGATGGLTRFDGVNAVLWDNPNGRIAQPFDCGSGGTIAIGGPWFDSDVRHMFNGMTYITAAGGDIVTNSNLACYFGRLRRAEEVLAHELGHVLGLGHSCGDASSGPCNTSAKNDALMRAFAHGDNRGARLGSDDRAGIFFLYGMANTPPDAPSGLSANASALEVVNLSWSDNSDNEGSFEIERSTGGNFSQIASVGSNVRGYTDNSAPSGTSVRYRVRASNGVGSSDYSNTASTTTLGEPPPSGLTATALDATRVRLDWADNGVAETGFQIEADGFGLFVPVATTAANTTSMIVDDLNPSTDYIFRVRSTGGPAGRSTFSGSAAAMTLAGLPNPCVEDDERLCLHRGRFRVQVFFTDGEDNVGIARVAGAGTADSGLLWFFDEANLEILIKVLDGCGINDHFWVSSAATTNLGYTLVVTDTETGATAIYTNAAGDPAPAIFDVGALEVCPGSSVSPSTGPRGRTRAMIEGSSDALIADLKSAPLDTASGRTATKESCGTGSDLLCLNDERFRVEVDFRTSETSGRGQAVPVAADSGLFWFFDENNWEMLVKVLDACGVNERFWVFSAATTNVEYTLTVSDTMTNEVRRYTNPLGELAPAEVDIDAFAVCP